MADHNYIPSPTFRIGDLLRKPPIRKTLDVVYTEDAGSLHVDEAWSSQAIVAGEPPIIIGHECVLDWSTEYQFGTIEMSGGATLDVPATVDGKDVLAVALHLTLNHIFTRSRTGVPGGRQRRADYCASEPDPSQPQLPCGIPNLQVLVDDTEVVGISGVVGTPPSGIRSPIDGDFQGTLILPGFELEIEPTWNVYRDPFQDYGWTLPLTYLFYSDIEPGESIPTELTFTWDIGNVWFGANRIAGAHDPGPYPAVQPMTLYDHTNAWVDVYPYVEREPAPDSNLMLVV